MKFYNFVLVESVGTLNATFKHRESNRNWDACLQNQSLTGSADSKDLFKAARKNVMWTYHVSGIFQLLCIIDTSTLHINSLPLQTRLRAAHGDALRRRGAAAGGHRAGRTHAAAAAHPHPGWRPQQPAGGQLGGPAAARPAPAAAAAIPAGL